MNVSETKKIATHLKKLGFTVSKNDSDQLWFAQKDCYGSLEFRDKFRNLCRMASYFFVWFEAGVNENGVGDGKSPRKALTYSIGFANPGKKRLYRHKNFEDAELFKFYNYSRKLGTLIKNFKAHLKLVTSIGYQE